MVLICTPRTWPRNSRWSPWTTRWRRPHLLAEHRLPGIVVTDSSGKPYAVLPASQVVRFIVPRYVQDDPSLAGVLGESSGRPRRRQA